MLIQLNEKIPVNNSVRTVHKTIKIKYCVLEPRKRDTS